MDKINFVSAAPRKKTQWSSKASLLFVLSITGIVIFLQIRQWNTLKIVKQKKSQHDQALMQQQIIKKNNDQLAGEKTELEKRLRKLKQAQGSANPYFNLFAAITQQLQTVGTLHALQLLKKKIQLTIKSPDIKRATQFMQTIRALPSVSSLNLVSIYPQENKLLFAMDGKLS